MAGGLRGAPPRVRQLQPGHHGVPHPRPLAAAVLGSACSRVALCSAGNMMIVTALHCLCCRRVIWHSCWATLRTLYNRPTSSWTMCRRATCSPRPGLEQLSFAGIYYHAHHGVMLSDAQCLPDSETTCALLQSRRGDGGAEVLTAAMNLAWRGRHNAMRPADNFCLIHKLCKDACTQQTRLHDQLQR